MTPAGALSERISTDLKAAMKARDHATVRVLRALHAAVANAEAPALAQGPAWPPREFDGSAEHPRLELTGADLAALVAHEIADRADTAATFRANDRGDAAAELDAEIDVLRRYA